MTQVQLLEYSNPPVIETVVGIEFSALPIGFMGLAAVHAMWKAEFPSTLEQEALPPSRPVAQGAQGFHLQWGSGLPPARLWMLSNDEHLLVQVQSDRLLLNWRRLDAESETYPRYESLRAKFVNLFDDFQGHVQKEFGMPVTPLAVEWTYVNRIEADDSNEGAMFSVWREPNLKLPGKSMLTRFNNVRELESHGLQGQLTVTAEPLAAGEGEPINLTVSTQFFLTPDKSPGDALGAMDDAHRYSRLAFDAITSDDAKKMWGTK